MILAAVIAIWALGFLAVAGRAAYGYFTLLALGRSGSIPFPRDDVDFTKLSRRMGCDGKWQVRECATREMAVPMTWGLFRATIMLPCDADRWSKGRLEAVVLHELAHVKRRDFATQAVVELACAILWFVPPVWTAAGWLRGHAEREADQAVVRSGMRASDYAAELLSFATELGHRRLPAIYVGTPAMKNAKIEARLHAVLSSNPPPRRISGAHLLSTFLAIALVGPALGALGSLMQGTTPPDRIEARDRMKQSALATIMYANDYDDVFPYVQQTPSARGVLNPYVKNPDSFLSPAPGGQFLYNVRIGGVTSSEVFMNAEGGNPAAAPIGGTAPRLAPARGTLINPAEYPLWHETLPLRSTPFAVGFADGHAALRTDRDAIDKLLARTLPRDKASKPLPSDWMIPAENPGRTPPPR